MQEEIRDFKGVWFPKEIWLNKDLTLFEKAILIEIDSLDNGNGCYASNEYLAGFCGCSIKTISSSITKLIDLGYLKLESFDGRKRVLKSLLSSQPSKNCYAEKKKLLGSKEKITRQDNNNINNTNTNNFKNIENNSIDNIEDKYSIICKSNDLIKKEEYKEEIPYKEIIEYLNDKIGTRYLSTGRKTRDLIKARWREGFRLEDFYTVIDKKVNDWFTDNQMKVYLRPETLFSNKFESYLNQLIKKKTTKDLVDVLDFSRFFSGDDNK